MISPLHITETTEITVISSLASWLYLSHLSLQSDTPKYHPKMVSGITHEPSALIEQFHYLEAAIIIELLLLLLFFFLRHGLTI